MLLGEEHLSLLYFHVKSSLYSPGIGGQGGVRLPIQKGTRILAVATQTFPGDEVILETKDRKAYWGTIETMSTIPFSFSTMPRPPAKKWPGPTFG